MSLKSLFTTACKTTCKYAGYFNDVLFAIPSEDVQSQLKEKGWRFPPSPEAAAMLDPTSGPFQYSSNCLLKTVTTENGTDVYRAAGPDVKARYEADKKTAARLKYGIK